MKTVTAIENNARRAWVCEGDDIGGSSFRSAQRAQVGVVSASNAYATDSAQSPRQRAIIAQGIAELRGLLPKGEAVPWPMRRFPEGVTLPELPRGLRVPPLATPRRSDP